MELYFLNFYKKQCYLSTCIKINKKKRKEKEISKEVWIAVRDPVCTGHMLLPSAHKIIDTARDPVCQNYYFEKYD